MEVTAFPDQPATERANLLRAWLYLKVGAAPVQRAADLFTEQRTRVAVWQLLRAEGVVDWVSTKS